MLLDKKKEEHQMKKTYISPKTIEIRIRTKYQLLTGSIGINSTGDAVDASGACSRGGGFNVWNEEELLSGDHPNFQN